MTETRSITVEVPTAVTQRLAEWHEGTLEHATITALKLYHGLGSEAYATLCSLAKDSGITPARALRAAVNALAREAAKVRLPSAQLGRPKVNEERDVAIFLRLSAGETYAAVARAFGLSQVRVGQIAALQRAKRGLNPRDNLKARNEDIVRRVEAGETRADVAAAFNLSRSVVDSIVSQAHADRPRVSKAAKGANVVRMCAALQNGMPIAQAATMCNMTESEATAIFEAYKAHLPADPSASDRMNAAILASKPEVLTLKPSEAPATAAPPAPRKLAVIPPSMRNPELFAEAKPIKIPDPAKVDVSMFDPNNPDFAI